jgi:DNA-binding MarR family transcriptional regulator
MKSRLVFHVLRALRSAEREAGAGELDLRARELLRIIGEEDARGACLSVGQLVKCANVGTAPTVYSALNQLESQGWIERSSDQPDGRTKRLTLSPRARKMFVRAYRIASVALGGEN